jgi:hypothetical protein
MVRYGKRADVGGYTFSLWAFPVARYPEVLREYFAFCREYERATGYRHDMVTVAYLVNQDDHNLFSYSRGGRVMTIDPVSTGGPGWEEFADAFNAFGSRQGGVPLFNQAPRLTAEQARKALGPRIEEFRRFQEALDPDRRFRNAFFARLFGDVGAPAESDVRRESTPTGR